MLAVGISRHCDPARACSSRSTFGLVGEQAGHGRRHGSRTPARSRTIAGFGVVDDVAQPSRPESSRPDNPTSAPRWRHRALPSDCAREQQQVRAAVQPLRVVAVTGESDRIPATRGRATRCSSRTAVVSVSRRRRDPRRSRHGVQRGKRVDRELGLLLRNEMTDEAHDAITPARGRARREVNDRGVAIDGVETSRLRTFGMVPHRTGEPESCHLDPRAASLSTTAASKRRATNAPVHGGERHARSGPGSAEDACQRRAPWRRRSAEPRRPPRPSHRARRRRRRVTSTEKRDAAAKHAQLHRDSQSRRCRADQRWQPEARRPRRRRCSERDELVVVPSNASSASASSTATISASAPLRSS